MAPGQSNKPKSTRTAKQTGQECKNHNSSPVGKVTGSIYTSFSTISFWQLPTSNSSNTAPMEGAVIW